MDQLFFSLWKNKNLLQKIKYSDIDYYIINNIAQLDKQYDYVLSLNLYGIPVVYNIKDLDQYNVYNLQTHKYLITHIIVSTHFYVNHYHIFLQEQQSQPILFGLSITTIDDLMIPAIELPHSIQYMKYTISEPLTQEYIPKSLTSMFIKTFTNIDRIPNGVRTLVMETFDYDPSEELKFLTFDNQFLPNSLTKLQYYDSFLYSARNFKINWDDLPPNLNYLSVYGGCVFTGNPNTFRTLKYLKCVSDKTFQIPQSVSKLRLYSSQLGSFTFPPNLSHLEFRLRGHTQATTTSPDKFPEQLTSLSLKNCSYSNITKNNCPPGLLYYRNRHHKIGKGETYYIPPSTTIASISIWNKMEELPILPSSLTQLKMTCYDSYTSFTKPFHSYFPDTIVKLTLQYTKELFVGLIPSSVTDLKLYSSQPILQGMIPPSVTKFHLVYNRMVKPIVIPNTVTCLGFQSAKQIYTELELPDSVKTFKVRYLDFKTFPFLDLFKTTLKHITRFSTQECISVDDFQILLKKLQNTNLLSNLKQMNINHLKIYSNYHIIDQQVVYKEDNHLMPFHNFSNLKYKYK